MSTTLTRRKFIEVGLALGAGLSAGSCTHLFDRPASQNVTITVVADAFAYYPSEPDPGFCLHVEAVTGGKPYGLLFDCGIQGPRLLDALHRCGIGPESINAVVLSHGHPDHAQGSLSVLEFLNQLEPKIPIYVTSGVFGDQEVLERLAQYRLERVAQKTEILPGIFATGPLPGADSAWAGYDDDVDEQAVFLNLDHKGLIVVSACSHRSLESAIYAAISQSGIKQVHAVIGGTHHERAPARIVNDTIGHLRSIGLKRVVPMHCSGIEAIATLRRALPDTLPFHQREGRYHVDSRMVFA